MLNVREGLEFWSSNIEFLSALFDFSDRDLHTVRSKRQILSSFLPSLMHHARSTGTLTDPY